jgi:diguanylate cyclase (GGDEF)-like protein
MIATAAGGCHVSTRRSAYAPVALLVTVTLLGQLAAVLDASARPYVLGASLLVLDAAGVGYSLWAARIAVPRAFRLIAAARFLSIAATVLLGVSTVTHNQVFWWIGTPARLLMFVAFSAAVVLPAELDGRRRWAFVAEAVTVLAGGFMVVFYTSIYPLLKQTSPNWQWLSGIGYPIGDLLLLMAVSLLVLRGAVPMMISPTTIHVAGLAVYIVADTAWASIGVHGEPASHSVAASFTLVLASMLMTTAPMVFRAMMRSPSPAGRVPRLERDWSPLLPLLALGVGCVLLVTVTIREHAWLPWGGLVSGLVVMTAAVATRQVISLRVSRDLIVTDSLTGLANRTGLDNAITKAVRRHDRIALLLVDLDGFKLINDAYGHAAGDTVLIEFAHHLRSAVRAGDVAARIGGDEFVVLLTGVSTPEQAGGAAQRILTAAAANPVRLGEDTLPVRASIGAAMGRAEDSTKELLRRADVAMYQAKRAGTHGWTMHDASMTDRRAEDAALGDDLGTALERDQLSVLYQPIVELTGGRPVAVEALVRWNHPVRGLVSPVRFIPIAERSGAIHAIGLFVLEQACRQISRWSDRLPAGQPLHVSVNLSPRQLQEPTVVHDILAVLERTGVPAERLVLEVTESAVVDQHAIAVLGALRSYGIRIAIDDFGTGYSSLHYLTRLPVDILKIDRSFVAELNGTPEGSAITEAVIRLSQVLHLTTVAEGIETGEQANELLLLGCDTGQGYLFSRPQPPAALDEMMTAPQV